jgi:hypothetical protein
MEMLLKDGKVRWQGYRIMYIPTKLFSVSRGLGSKKQARTIYDISGFFQVGFKNAIRKWKVGSPDEWELIDRMKDARADFGPVTDEVLEYNHLEGKHGIQLFQRVREEYTKLGLRLPRPVGAGSIASAMFRVNRLDDYMPTFQSLPTEVMLQCFIGGRFDIAALGFVGTTYQYDINSAYPFIATQLPCLSHSKFEWSDGYVPDRHSLWLVRWSDNDNRWSPFPYRAENGHIRYHSSGMGYYFGAEVESALQLDSDIEILGGYQLLRNCDHKPFQWIADYYKRRQEMLRDGNFGEQIIKLGLNAAYGKLAQTRGRTPHFQNLIWAGMITSGTRAMLLSAIAQNPENVIACATDAVVTYQPINLHVDPTTLGAWKQSQMDDLLILGNGIYHSPTKDKDGKEIAKSRGFSSFNWEQVRRDYADHGTSVAIKHEFIGFAGALREHRLHERGGWVDEEVELRFEIPKGKILEREWIWPGANPTPLGISHPAKIDRKQINIPGVSQKRDNLPSSRQ